MKKIKICLDKAKMGEINHKYWDCISEEIAKYPREFHVDKIEEIEDMIAMIGQEGQMFCPSTFSNHDCRKENFEQIQLFPLFFYEVDIKANEAFKRARKYGIAVMFVYRIFSSGNKNNFTLVFQNETPIYRYEEAEAMMAALLEIFPEASHRYNGILKVYNGGNKVYYYNKKNTINHFFLFAGLSYYFKDRYGINNYKRYLIKFAKKTGLVLNSRKLPDISIVKIEAEVKSKLHGEKFDNFSPSSIINNSNNGDLLSPLIYEVNLMNSSNSIRSINSIDDKDVNNSRKYKKESCKDSLKKSISSINNVTDNINDINIVNASAINLQADKKSKKHKLYRSSDLPLIYGRCRLYRDLVEGNTKFTDKELLGIISNLIYVESGEKEFSNFLKLNIYYERKKEVLDKWQYYFFHLKESETLPCSTFCRYHDKCSHGANILSSAKVKYHEMVDIENYNPNYVDLEEAWLSFYDNFWEAIESGKKIWHIITSQTALGKTEAILMFLKDTDLRVLIVVPTNKLKQEVYCRAKDKGIKIVVSPSLHEILDELPSEVGNNIKAIYDSGQSPMAYVNKLISEEDPRCTKILKKYKEELKEFFESDSHAITTHRRLSSLDLSKYDLVIVDEDILYSTVIPNRDTIEITKLKKLEKKLETSDPLAVKIRSILRKRKEKELFKCKKIKYDKKYLDLKTFINIPALCEAEYFCYRKEHDKEEEECIKEACISFVKPIKFQKDVKYIMLSATANKDICQYYFGEKNVAFYECKEAKMTGILIHYYDRTMSRSYVYNHLGVYGEIKRKIKVDDFITFQRFEKDCGTEWHFGNCVGCDVLKGKDIAVIGTPHQPEWIYKLFAFSLGFKIEEKASNMDVGHNGKIFRFNTYQNEVLRKIQFYMIESELEQAVGRARLLRCDCVVYLFSNFPLKQAKKQKFIEDNTIVTDGNEE